MISELEKKLSGKLYIPNIDYLVRARSKAKSLCYEYNNLTPHEID